MEIDDEILKETTCCEKDFSCLKNGKLVLCTVEKCINDKVHFVHCLESKYCNYRFSFGTAFICSCPTRKEIYRVFRK